MRTEPEQPPSGAMSRAGTRTRFLPWVFGALTLSALVVIVVHVGELEHFAALAREARPAWLILAAIVQVGTYACLAGVWQLTITRAGHRSRFISLIPLGVAKLFIDQAVPTGGVSGLALVVHGLSRRGVPAGTAATAMVVGIVTFYAAYLVLVLTSLGLLWLHQDLRPAIVAAVTGFCAFAVAVPGGVLLLKHYSGRSTFPWLTRIPVAQTLLNAMGQASAPLLDWHVLPRAALLQLLLFGLDAMTLWLAFKALGQNPAPWIVLVGFTMASVAATIGPIPLGLGTFEAGAVAMLHMLGVPVESALAATLLFRGLSFWLPMLPGLWLAPREMKGR